MPVVFVFGALEYFPLFEVVFRGALQQAVQRIDGIERAREPFLVLAPVIHAGFCRVEIPENV